jgi:hypothetical protein
MGVAFVSPAYSSVSVSPRNAGNSLTLTLFLTSSSSRPRKAAIRVRDIPRNAAISRKSTSEDTHGLPALG